jgi:hypothetical protein
MEQYQSILEDEVHDIAYENGAVQRKGKLDAATLVQVMIFGFWQVPDLRLSGLAQIGGRREVHVTESLTIRVSRLGEKAFLAQLEKLSMEHLGPLPFLLKSRGKTRAMREWGL